MAESVAGLNLLILPPESSKLSRFSFSFERWQVWQPVAGILKNLFRPPKEADSLNVIQHNSTLGHLVEPPTSMDSGPVSGHRTGSTPQ